MLEHKMMELLEECKRAGMKKQDILIMAEELLNE